MKEKSEIYKYMYVNVKLFLIVLLIGFSKNTMANYVYGRYTGNGTSSTISGVGFQPEVILVKALTGNDSWIATSTMSAGYAKQLTGTVAPITGIITTIDADGFTVGSSALSNSNGVEYFFIAWDDSDGSIDVGSFTPTPEAFNSSTNYNADNIVEYGGLYYTNASYVGSGGANPDVSGSWSTVSLENVTSATSFAVGYRPTMVWSFGEGTAWFSVGRGQFLLDGNDPTLSRSFNNGAALGSAEEIVSGLSATGFTITTPTSTASETNNGTVQGTKYNYVAFNGGEVGTYTGTGSDGLKVTTSTANPQVVFAMSQTASNNPWFKTPSMGGDTSYKFTDIASTISVKTLESDGFTLGTNGEVNTSSSGHEYIVFGGGSPLPVELISFNGKLINDKVKLTWKTASEINSDYFLVQRSIDGINFETIGKVSAQGNSSSIVNYDFVDTNPTEGNNYYRLKQVDYNREYEYFKTVVINTLNGNSISRVNVFPNPANGVINLSFNQAHLGLSSLIIFDERGRKVYIKEVNISEDINEFSIDVSDLAIGLYTVVVKSQNGFQSFSKFVKK